METIKRCERVLIELVCLHCKKEMMDERGKLIDVLQGYISYLKEYAEIRDKVKEGYENVLRKANETCNEPLDKFKVASE